MQNEEAIVETLSKHGATILEMESTPVETTIEALLGAKMVIGVEGSHLCHAVFAIPDDASVLAIQPPDRFFNAPKDWTDALDIRYGFVVGDPAGNAFALDADDLLRTIDLLNS